MTIRDVVHLIDLCPRAVKRIIAIVFDVWLGVASTWAIFFFRYDESFTPTPQFIVAATVSVLLLVSIFLFLGLYRTIFRYTEWVASTQLIKATFIYAALYSIIFSIIKIDGIPRSTGIFQPMLVFVGLVISRLTVKVAMTRLGAIKRSVSTTAVALIYGAGSAGRQIAAGLRQGVGVKLVGFVDDDSRLWKSTVNGLSVYSPAEIPKLLGSDLGVTDILLAMPSAGRLRRQEILKELSNFPVHVRSLPSLSELANGAIKIEDIRYVEIDDVLGREAVLASDEHLHQNVTGKSVLVTGAGGSIGSELCRQIAQLKATTLVLFELNEFALYTIERQLTQLEMDIRIVPILGSVLDVSKLTRVIKKFEVQTVYHAAAYKHVPMIEMNPAAGVWNNVFGTLRAVDVACRCGVKNFVLVSTDKAVRPTNVMGCSKRLAELVLQAKNLQQRRAGIHSVKLTMVRFGNVLGSSGSVIPVFREQIRLGGPITVTHPEIIRYFMTIPEAAQLVIQAGAIGEGGDVMVLDMGEPVKIVDLAKRMIHLSGLSHKDASNPEGDIDIQFTGLRPGEKLYEELLIGDNTSDTCNSRIMRAAEPALDWDILESILLDLEAAVKAEDSTEILVLLKRAVPEFNPLTQNSDVLKEVVVSQPV